MGPSDPSWEGLGGGGAEALATLEGVGTRLPRQSNNTGVVAGPWGPIAHCSVCAHPRCFRWKTGSG